MQWLFLVNIQIGGMSADVILYRGHHEGGETGLIGKRRGLTVGKWGKGLLAAFVLAGALQLPATAESAAASNVRVAMFLDLGSTYKSTVPAVTLKPASAAEIGLSTSSSMDTWIQAAAGQSLRFSVSGYRVKALESSDWKTAAAAAKKLQGTADKPSIFEVKQSGGTVYRIYTGPYASSAEAQKAADRINSSLSAQLDGAKAVVRGAYYTSAGTFGSLSEAEALSQSLNAGHEAFVVLTGPGQYAVWIGGAASPAEQSTVQNEVAKTSANLSLSAVDNTKPALILHEDVTLNLSTPSTVEHYETAGEGAKWIVRGGGDSTIQIIERSGHKYRGNFEISRVNGQLALVNELPLEQYLYSVVAAEVPSSWPQEALKAQAVAARSYAVFNAAGNRFKVAGLVDTTLSQVYNGADKEVSSIVQAVDSTAGEVIKADGKVVEGIFSSNSGGVTADSSEVWNSLNQVYTSVSSKEDKVAQGSLKSWYHVLLSDGKTGYVREDNTAVTGTTAAGLQKLSVTNSSVLVRPLPQTQSSVNPVAKMNPGDQAIVLDKVDESGSYAWIRGPYTSEELLKSLKGKTSTEAPSPISNLEVTQRGPSGRATQVKANGQVLDVRYPDSYRSALNGLPSTLFDIVSTGRYTVQGAGGNQGTGTTGSGAAVLSANGVSSWSGGDMVVMGGNLNARVVSQKNEFLFMGYGNGHGLGLSQWGAKGLADAGYDYQQILQHYYQHVNIVKE